MPASRAADLILGLYWNERGKRWDLTVSSSVIRTPINLPVETRSPIDPAGCVHIAHAVREEMMKWLEA